MELTPGDSIIPLWQGSDVSIETKLDEWLLYLNREVHFGHEFRAHILATLVPLGLLRAVLISIYKMYNKSEVCIQFGTLLGLEAAKHHSFIMVVKRWIFCHEVVNLPHFTCLQVFMHGVAHTRSSHKCQHYP